MRFRVVRDYGHGVVTYALDYDDGSTRYTHFGIPMNLDPRPTQ